MPFWCFLTCRFSSGRDQTRRWLCLACRCPEPPRFSAEGSDGDTLCGPKSSSSPHVYLWKKALAQPLKDRYKKSIFIREGFADMWSSSMTIAVLESYLTGPCMSWWGGRSGSPPGSRTCGCLVGWCRSDCRCPAQHIRQCLQTERGELWDARSNLSLKSFWLTHRKYSQTFSKFLQALTLAGFLVHLQAVSSGTGAIETNLQVAACVRTAAIVELALVNICGNADTDDSGF